MNPLSVCPIRACVAFLVGFRQNSEPFCTNSEPPFFAVFQYKDKVGWGDDGSHKTPRPDPGTRALVLTVRATVCYTCNIMAAQLDRKYEKFLGGPTEPPDQRIHVSIDRRGVITFNARCYRELGKPVAVYLHFSRIDDTIAVEPVSSSQLPAAFPLRPNGTAWYLNSAPFCRHFGIRLDSTQRFISPDFRDGALHLKLADTVTISRMRVKTAGNRN